MKLRNLFAAALLALAGLLGAPAAALAVATSQVAVASDQWYDLGVGPIAIQSQGGLVQWTVGDSQPAANVAYWSGGINFGGPQPINVSTHVWAKAALPGASIQVIVTPLAATSGTPLSPSTAVVAPYPYLIPGAGQHNLPITSSTALTVPAGATYATVQVSGASAKYTTDGTTTPTSTVGTTLYVGPPMSLSGPTVLANFRAISATGTLDVEYFK